MGICFQVCGVCGCEELIEVEEIVTERSAKEHDEEIVLRDSTPQVLENPTPRYPLKPNRQFSPASSKPEELETEPTGVYGDCSID